MIPERRFYEALRGWQQRQRIPLDTIWGLFHAHVPAKLTRTDARTKLATILQSYADAGLAQLPRSKGCWDYSAAPRLPLWARLKPEHAGPARLDHRAIPWPHELAFVAKLSRVEQLDELLAIKRFLANGGRNRQLVPKRERSAELFRDEKRLDALMRSALFEPGRLSLDVLRCHEVVAPMVFERGPPGGEGRPLLIVENLHTYASFRRWNKRHGEYAAVAFGHGAAFRKSVRDVPRLRETVSGGQIEYFGDLDAKGIEIPCESAVTLLEISGLQLVAASRWYELLLDRDPGFPQPRTKRSVDVSRALVWLPSDLSQRVAELFARGLRLPQELVGWEQLQAATR
ncbi:MAG TPA: hypothetical protein ENJ18_16885 [Nannocystis exedens]|nr:hypothetical protein [Nannocystis exedens]